MNNTDRDKLNGLARKADNWTVPLSDARRDALLVGQFKATLAVLELLERQHEATTQVVTLQLDGKKMMHLKKDMDDAETGINPQDDDEACGSCDLGLDLCDCPEDREEEPEPDEEEPESLRIARGRRLRYADEETS